MGVRDPQVPRTTRMLTDRPRPSSQQRVEQYLGLRLQPVLRQHRHMERPHLPCPEGRLLLRKRLHLLGQDHQPRRCWWRHPRDSRRRTLRAVVILSRWSRLPLPRQRKPHLLPYRRASFQLGLWLYHPSRPRLGFQLYLSQLPGRCRPDCLARLVRLLGSHVGSPRRLAGRFYRLWWLRLGTDLGRKPHPPPSTIPMPMASFVEPA